MDFRASEEDIMAKVLEDTKEFISNGLIEERYVETGMSVEVFCKNFSSWMSDREHMMPQGRLADCFERLDGLLEATTKCDYELLAPHLFLANCMNGGINFDGCHNNAIGNIGASIISMSGGVLKFKIYKKHPDNMFLRDLVYSISGKPTKIIARLFGEKAATGFSQDHPFRKHNVKLHLTTHYIPELYRTLAKNENLSSCMSKRSDHYGLPAYLHPTMAYENSSNAALALLFDEGKGRHVARAIVKIDDGKLLFNRAYGTSGCTELFQKLGLEYADDMDGLELSRIEYDGEILLPYVDGPSQSVDDEGDYLVVSKYGELEVDIDTGRAAAPQQFCVCCQDSYNPHETEFYHTEDGYVCEGCYDYYVEVDGEMVHRDNHSIVYIASRDRYVREDDAFYCDYNEECYEHDRHSYYEIKTVQGSWYTVCDQFIDDAINHYDVAEIDGEELISWLIENRDYEPEQEEAA